MKQLFSLMFFLQLTDVVKGQVLSIRFLGGPNLHINSPISISNGGSFRNTSLNYQFSASAQFEYKRFGVEFGYMKRKQNLQFAPFKPLFSGVTNEKAGEVSIPYFTSAFPVVFSFKNQINEKFGFKALVGTYIGLMVNKRFIGEPRGNEFISSGGFISNLDGFQNAELYYEFEPVHLRLTNDMNFFEPTLILGFEVQYQLKERFHLLLRMTGSWSTFPLLAGELRAGIGNAQLHQFWYEYLATDYGQNIMLDVGMQYQIIQPKKSRKRTIQKGA